MPDLNRTSRFCPLRGPSLRFLHGRHPNLRRIFRSTSLEYQAPLPLGSTVQTIDFAIRRLRSCDSLDTLTHILHRAFDDLARRGIECQCANPSVDLTNDRVRRGECFIAVSGSKMGGSAALRAPCAGHATRGRLERWRGAQARIRPDADRARSGTAPCERGLDEGASELRGAAHRTSADGRQRPAAWEMQGCPQTIRASTTAARISWRPGSVVLGNRHLSTLSEYVPGLTMSFLRKSLEIVLE